MYIFFIIFPEMSGKKIGRPKSLETNVHVCRACGKRFSQIFNVKRHYEAIHGQERKFPCRLCKQRFLTGETREQHVRADHPDSLSYRCGKCDYATNNMEQLGKHVSESHPKPPSEMKQLALEKKRRREVDKKEMKEAVKKRRKEGLKLLTDCVQCGLRFESQAQVVQHLEEQHPMPTDYAMEATAFHTSCQCWVKHYPHTTRSPDEPYGTRQEEKRRAAANLTKIIEAERGNVHRIVGNILQTHRLFKYCIIPFVRMSRQQLKDPLGQDTRADLEQIFKLRSQQYTASVAVPEGSLQNFHGQFNTMKQMVVTRMEDRLLEEVRNILLLLLFYALTLHPFNQQGSGWVFEGVECFHVEISQCHHRFGAGSAELDGPEAMKEMRERLQSMLWWKMV